MQQFLEQFQERFDTLPKLMQFDEGSEFLNKDVIPVLKEKNITYFTSFSKRKAAVVERFNRTLKEKMMKLFYEQKSHHWVEHLSDLVENYNNQVNRSIDETPSDVGEENKHLVWTRLFSTAVGKIPKPRYKKGDLVRVLDFKPKDRELQKIYRDRNPNISKVTGKRKQIHAVQAKNQARFSEEVFEIKKVLLGYPTMYKLYSRDNDIDILGKFYERELSHVVVE